MLANLSFERASVIAAYIINRAAAACDHAEEPLLLGGMDAAIIAGAQSKDSVRARFSIKARLRVQNLLEGPCKVSRCGGTARAFGIRGPAIRKL